MGFFKKISAMFSTPSQNDQNAYWVYVRCKRCGEKIAARIDLHNDLSADYDSEQTSYVCRKVLMGEGRCFQQIEVVLRFDENRKPVDQEVGGGELISAAEFEAQAE